MSFKKPLETAGRKAKSTASTMIGNGLDYCCQVVEDISVSENDETKYPTEDDMEKWYDGLFTKEFKLKVIPPKALENMKKRGIPIKKQPAEIMNFVIATSESHVHMGIMFPGDSTYKISDMVPGFIGNAKYTLTDKDNYTLVSYEAQFPLKEKDDLQRSVFNHLRTLGIAEDDESEDEIYDLESL